MTSWLQLMTGFSITSVIPAHPFTDFLSTGILWALFLDAYGNAASFLAWVMSLFFAVSPVIFILSLLYLVAHGAAKRISHL